MVPRSFVTFVDHTSVPGGAELALARVLAAQSDWNAALLYPHPRTPRPNSFAELPSDVAVAEAGPEQPAGLATESRFGAKIRGAWSLMRFAFALRMKRSFREAHVVHANTTRAAVAVWLARPTRGSLFVIHLRDAVSEESLGRIGSAALRRALRRADGVVANSASTLATIPPASPARRRIERVIPSPIGDFAPRGRPSGVSRPLVVGMAARVAPWKGHELVIDAFAQIAARIPDLNLEFAGGTFFGEGPYLSSLRARVAELGLASRVAFLGHVDDLASRMQTWDICVQYSTTPEPLGQNVLQYLALCKPTIAAREGGPTEWIENGVNGILVEPRDAAALAKALCRVIEDDALRVRLVERLVTVRLIPTDGEVAEMYAAYYAELRATSS